MCDQPNCNHDDLINLSARDKKLIYAYTATLAMRLLHGTENASQMRDILIASGRCGLGCSDPKCGLNEAMLDSLARAINHVDNDAELEVRALYDEMFNVEPPQAIDPKPLTIFVGFEPTDDGFIDTIVIDAPPEPIKLDGPPTTPPGTPRVIGRMVGADRNRDDDLLN